MLKEVTPHLYIGDLLACSRGVISPGHALLIQPHATIHAAKDPCHRVAIGYFGKNLAPTHPDYLYKEVGTDLFLNLIDPPTPLFQIQTFWTAIRFIKKHIADLPVIVHCNLGLSRSPALILAYAAHVGIAPKESYEQAYEWLKSVYADVSFGKGIDTYLEGHWEDIVHAGIQTQAAARSQGSDVTRNSSKDAPNETQHQGDTALYEES